MYIIIAFACIYRDGIKVSGQTLIMYISYNDQNLALNQNPAHLWPVTVMFVLFYLHILPGVSCRMCSSQRRHPASSIPEKHTTWSQVEKKVERFFFSVQICAWVLFCGSESVHSISTCTSDNNIRLKVCEGRPGHQATWLIFDNLKLPKTSGDAWTFPKGSAHVQRMCMHTSLPLFWLEWLRNV